MDSVHALHGACRQCRKKSLKQVVQWPSVGADLFSGRLQWLQILFVSTEIRYMLVIRCVVITSQQPGEDKHCKDCGWGQPSNTQDGTSAGQTHTPGVLRAHKIGPI